MRTGTSHHYTGPAELTLRVGGQDLQFVRRLYGLVPGIPEAPHLPARLVVDAHVPLGRGAGLSAAAREAGVPFLIDPETYYLQDTQHAEADWCKTPFGYRGEHMPLDLMSTGAQDTLVKQVIDYQIEHGASAVIAPYVHIDKPGDRWPEVQAALWERTAAYVEKAGIHLPVIAVVAIGWRCLHPLRGMPHLAPMWDALAELGPSEIGLAVSKAHMGAKPEDRIAEMLMAVRQLRRNYKVTMWQQGLLGELCVVDGAAGYETGIGWREKCDLQTRKASQRRAPDGHPAARPIFISELGRGVPKSRLQLARSKRRVWARLVCPFPDCCAPAGEDLLGDARRHSVVSRARELAQLDATHASPWRWQRLAERAAQGIAIAQDLNALAPASRSTPSIDSSTLFAIYQVANARRTRRGAARRTA